MTDVLFIYWMISGTILSIVLSIISKSTVVGCIFGFILAPALPFILIGAAVSTYLEHRASTK